MYLNGSPVYYVAGIGRLPLLLLLLFPGQLCSNMYLFPNPATILYPWQSICCGSAGESHVGVHHCRKWNAFIFPLFSSLCAAGIPDVAKGRVGSDSGRHLPWTHARAHLDEVHLHQPIWVRAPALSRCWGCCSLKSTVGRLLWRWGACSGLCQPEGCSVPVGSVQRYGEAQCFPVLLRCDVMTAVIIRYQVRSSNYAQ